MQQAPEKPSNLVSADQQITLEPSETLFAVLATLNTCGYDQELDNSDPLRKAIREDVQANIADTKASEQVCSFYKEHDLGDPSRNLSQYISLALNTTEPPKFQTTVRESDLPPDASQVLGFLPFLQGFYDQAKLHAIWLKHQRDYAAFVDKLHGPLHDEITKTDLYLKLPFTGVADRRFSVLVDPQGAPGQVNARNYANDYYVVVSPSANGALKLDQIRHTYLHYVLDPYALSRGTSMQRLSPLLEAVRTAPLDAAYQNDIHLLTEESLIKAIEARMLPQPKDKKQVNPQSTAAVDQAMAQGFILTRYFFGKLADFELSPASFKDEFGQMLYAIDVNEIKKVANNTVFASQGTQEVVGGQSVKQASQSTIQQAEQKLANGDVQGAQQLAQEVLKQDDSPDAGRALFLLAMSASKQGEMDEARGYFERTLQVAKEPRLVAWSHIYLGRIFDLQDNRENALMHYNAALNSGDSSQDTKAAAQKGIDHPMQAPKSSE
ncbi:MAG TPA: tetratricopeptide repeat protein [Terriglobales bacterium]